MIHHTISIHALLAESDAVTTFGAASVRDFYPRSPCGERPRRTYQQGEKLTFLSTLSLRRATHYDNYNLHCIEISIHALLAESDQLYINRTAKTIVFLSTLSLRRATHLDTLSALAPKQFLSTLSLRRATLSCFVRIMSVLFLSTLSLRRATLMPLTRFFRGIFLSTLSLRRATDQEASNHREQQISIHALLAESDPTICNGISPTR